jgi:DNA-binding GntR family transcriptional regulator
MPPLKRGPTPYYHQIAAILRDQIDRGALRVGERMPSEEALCRMFDVSRATVRQAIQSLVSDGIVRREAGRGTFVREQPVEKAEFKMTCLLEDLIALGIPAQARLIDSGMVRPGPSVAEALGLAADEDAFSAVRVITVNGEPFSIRNIYMPAAIGNRLNAADLRDERLLAAISRRCGLEVIEADQMIEAVLADAGHGNTLGVAAGTALLAVTRTSFARARIPVEHSVTLYRSDRTRFCLSQRQRKKGSDDWVLATSGGRPERGIRPI